MRQVTLTCAVCHQKIRRSDQDHAEHWTVHPNNTTTVLAWHNPCNPGQNKSGLEPNQGNPPPATWESEPAKHHSRVYTRENPPEGQRP